MAIVSKYRIWCNTEKRYFCFWTEHVPISCPNSPEHSLDVSKTVVEDTVCVVRRKRFVNEIPKTPRTAIPSWMTVIRDNPETGKQLFECNSCGTRYNGA